MAKKRTGAKQETVSPDKGEPEKSMEPLRNEAIEIPPDARFPIVGIGASAGGLAAFEAFFSGMPANADPGMAFVLVQHLAPDHKSILTDLIRRYTRMEVFEVEDGMKVLPNCTYIIPPNRDMAFLNGSLQLLEPSSPRGQRLPIDFFFRSLAHDQHERAIGIVLSGTGSDGTMGIRAIKGEGGMVMAQSPDSTEYDGMPRSAIATGLVDFELAAAAMPAQLIAYASHAFGHTRAGTVPEPKAESALKKVFIILRAQTGHDFSQYKPSTINRRIERRMAVHQISLIDDYVKYLRQTPPEVEALFRDLLIGVTNFFRDSEAFENLDREVIARLFIGKQKDSVVRVWVPGCSSGEEAYSIAILLAERQETLRQSYTFQIFATDIDSQAIARARAGFYTASVAADISPERLARFFIADTAGGGYRIHKGIRDMIVFSEQNMIKDPPFSKLDLISCRNLLIYLGTDLQKKIIPMFHYALNPGGVLFLGTSESVGEFADLFNVIDRKGKLYKRKDDAYRAQLGVMGRFLPPMSAISAARPKHAPGGQPAFPIKLPLQELTEQALLRQCVPAGALVNAKGDIFYIHGRTGMYLEPAPGEVGVYNILKMAREGMRQELTIALHKAVTTKETVQVMGLRVKTNGDFTRINLTISPIPVTAVATEAPMFLVILESAPVQVSPVGLPSDPERAATQAGEDADKPTYAAGSLLRISTLERRLHANEEYLQTANEKLETSNEELKSSNEEMQSVNEELQSTNEELETSKEELQSVNEELSTVNTELQTKVSDLARANNDMNTLLAGTGIATVFVDYKMTILRFTPTTSAIINVIASDVGRPISHIVSNLPSYNTLVADIKDVLDTLIPKEVEVHTADDKFFMMRIQPYRTMENVIEGAVITFVNITEMQRMRESLRKANEQLRLAVVVRDARDAITVQDLDGRIIAWNPGAVRIYGWSEAEALAMNIRDLIPKELREAALARVQQLSLAQVLEPYRTKRISKDGSVLDVWMTATALVNEAGNMYAIATTERTAE